MDNNKPDKTYITTIMMMSAITLSYPFDVPEFIPRLLTSLVRHSSFTTFQSPIARCIQQFKRSHQDRWEEFQKQFTREQLEDIQGAGSAHYFS